MAYEGHQRWYRITYDLWCQYKKHMRERITREKFPNLPEAFWELLERVLGGIPTIHLLGHIWLCRALYAYAHMKGSGKTTGEIVETNWSETKVTSGSVKRENHGQRHDDLDAALGDWNYNKLIKMGSSILCYGSVSLLTTVLASALSDKYVKAVKTHDDLLHKFQKASAAISPNLLSKWEAYYKTDMPTEDDESIVDRFEVNFKGISKFAISDKYID